MIDISPSQIQEFDDVGFLVLREYIPADLVARLRSAVESAIADALAPANGDSSSTEFCFTSIEGVPFVIYVDHLHRHAGPASLELAGSPQMSGIGRAFCGNDYLASYEYAVVKTHGDGERIPWHQDMIHDRSSRILNFGLYLSDATMSDGAICLIPRTQHGAQDICAIEADAASERIIIEMEPGDVLLHDVMLAHSSGALASPGQRIVLYFELRSLEHLQNNPGVSSEWISARRRLRELAERSHQQSNARGGAVVASTELDVIQEVYDLPAKRETARYCIPH